MSPQEKLMIKAFLKAGGKVTKCPPSYGIPHSSLTARRKPLFK